MSEFERYLASPSDRGDTSPEKLRGYGREAAESYIKDERPLNESIAEFAKEAKLNGEQVKRVVEYANNDTFASLFKLGHDKNITFPMADASAVQQTMGSTITKTAHVQPTLPKKRYIPGQENADLEGMFDIQSNEEQEKLASYEADRSESTRKFLNLSTAKKRIDSDLEAAGVIFTEKLAHFVDVCREAHREGNDPAVIGAAIESATPSEGLVRVLKTKLGSLVHFGHLEKVAMAGMAVMPGNPVSDMTTDLEQVASRLVALQQASSRTQMAMSELLSVLKGPSMEPPTSQLFQPGGQPPPAGPMAGPPPPAPPGPMAGPPASATPPLPPAGPQPPVAPGG